MINIDEFRNAIQSVGLIPPDVIEPGELHRFPGTGKRNGNTAGWCKLFDDGMGGVYGDWSQDFTGNWQAGRSTPLTPIERESFLRQVSESKAQADAERIAKQSDAAAKAAAIWQAAQPPASDHPYLLRKAIRSNGAKMHNGALVIPMREGAALHSLQFIGADGLKRFLTDGRKKGCYFSIGTPKGAAALCIAEGFATGATIHEATGLPVAVAFDAGNLEPVALAIRARFPDLPIVICADDDANTEGNPGVTKATAAALKVGGKLAIPDFGEDRPKGATDFNDMAAHCGKEEVQRAIASAIIPAIPAHQPIRENAPHVDVEGWPAPQEMTAKINALPYPIDALPAGIQAAVIEVQAFVQAPIPMVASSALSALSLAMQAHGDVQRADKLTGPISIALLTIAESGERKSTCDGFFTKAIRDYEAQQAESAKPFVKRYKAALGAWEAKCSGVKEKIKQLAKGSQCTDAEERRLHDLEKVRPVAPRVPQLFYADVTPEALAYELAMRWPSGGVVSAEAGIVFGSHAMKSDSVMRNLATLNQLWDGNAFSIHRKTSESFTVRGARLTMALQVQEQVLRDFFKQSGALARGSGFLARFLIGWPESTQGHRPFTEAPANWPHLAAFDRRIAKLLNQPTTIDVDGALNPTMLAMTTDAKAAWVDYHNAIEAELSGGGDYFEVKDVASKSADNAARLAALFQLYEGGSAIGVNAFESASLITAWHLHESRRFFGELALPAEMADAARLDTWLIEHCKRERVHFVSTRDAQRLGPVRDKEKFAKALHDLEELDRARMTRDGRQRNIKVNPALIGLPS